MAEVGKHLNGDFGIHLTAEEAQRLLDLLYVVEDVGEYALYAQLIDLDLHTAMEFKGGDFHSVEPHSIQIVAADTTSQYVDRVRDELPEGASLQVTEGSGNTVLNITVPR